MGSNLCEFCAMLDYLKALTAKDGYIKHVYNVKIVDEMYVNGFFRGQSTHGSMALKFCPACGKKLEEE